ncbi:TlpA family protein disulfide reductase [Nesterenkonia muleiensis]|uniref:TlpA family protein disulfide reductase n=1 Tax=Nesterenkonia muleiensis TaxID=2282648 RepID=UPI000E73AC56|nr:thioredoxin family protein [Nesterenkonia muleiensis]
MSPNSALLLVLGIVLVFALVGVLMRRRANRRRRASPAAPDTAQLLGLSELGSTATLVQFSTQFCSRCPGMRRALEELTGRFQHVVLHEVDLTEDLATAKALNILQTPTVLVLDSAGNLAARYAGATDPRALEAELIALRDRQL